MQLTARQRRAIRRAQHPLQAARKTLGLSQGDVAKHLGVTQSRLSVWERHTTNVSLDTAYMFAEYYGCSIEDLFPARQERVAS